jgi:glycosyltransferase involved in cell wall biosynthesis
MADDSETAPCVSVVLRTYDHEPFIAQAIESVLIQRADFPFELVIAEDCSTDGTRGIVKEYAERAPHLIKAVLPERNLGHGEIFRLALEEASGDFVAYLDGDDYWTSTTKLARQVEFLARNRECASCFHDVSLIYDKAGLPSGTVTPRLGEGRFSLEEILMECFVPAPSMMFRRTVANELPQWVFESAWIDWLIHIKAAEHGPIGYLPEALAAYRVHRGGMFSALDRVTQLEEDNRFYTKLLPELPEKRELIERCLALRNAQLAIERLGVPFEACVVLVDPRHEFRPYFNGRHARNLPRREGREVTELEAIRKAAIDLPPAIGDYGTQIRASDHPQSCYVVVPGGSADWLSARPQLEAYLALHGEIAWQDASVSVHELVPPEEGGDRSRGTRRVEVTMLETASDLPAAYLDAPASGALLPAHAVAVVGWVVGADGPAVAIEFEAEGEIVWRAPVTVERADVAAAFPGVESDRPGFQTTLNVQEIPATSTVTVFAVFADGSRPPLAELRFPVPARSQTADTS